MKALALEWYKSRRRGFWLLALSMSVVVFVWMAVGLRNMDAKEKAQGFAFCLYQAPILNSIVFPVMVAALMSRMCDMEHKGSAMKELFTMQTPQSMFTAKLACAGIYLFAATALQVASFALVGRIYGFTETIPVASFWLYLLSQWLVSLFLALVIEILSLHYINQFIPLVAGLIGGFLGLMALFFPPFIMRLVPSAYYGLLSTVCMDWDPAARTTDFYYVSFSVGDCAVLAALGVLIFLVARRHFGEREV